MTEEEQEKIEIFPFIEGESIDLVAQNSKWIPLYYKWNNNPQVRHYLRHTMPSTPEQIKK